MFTFAYKQIQTANISFIYIYNADLESQLKIDIHFLISLFHTVRPQPQMNTFKVDQSLCRCVGQSLHPATAS